MGILKSKRPLLAPGFTEMASAINPGGGIISTELAQGVVRGIAVSMTASQLFGMFTTPFSLLPAPGAGFAILVDQLTFEMTATSTAFAAGGAVSFVYHGGAVSPVTGTVLAAVVTTATPGTTQTLLGPPVATNGITVPANTGIDITNAGGAFTTGTGSARVHLRYRIITL